MLGQPTQPSLVDKTTTKPSSSDTIDDNIREQINNLQQKVEQLKNNGDILSNQAKINSYLKQIERLKKVAKWRENQKGQGQTNPQPIEPLDDDVIYEPDVFPATTTTTAKTTTAGLFVNLQEGDEKENDNTNGNNVGVPVQSSDSPVSGGQVGLCNDNDIYSY